MAIIRLSLLVLAIASCVYGQTCGVTGANGTTITLEPVLETTTGDQLIWSNPTYNITGGAAVSSPHVRYLTGLRYPSRYEYTTSGFFAEFVQTERLAQIRRDVIFTCADGTTVPYTFYVPVIDENTEKPNFEHRNYNATASQSNNSTEPTTANIVVADGDYELENANVIIRSSNALVTPFVIPIWSGEHPNPYVYRVDFFVSKSLAVGNYQIIFTADDGRFSDFAIVDIEVTP